MSTYSSNPSLLTVAVIMYLLTNKNRMHLKKEAYRDGIKRKADKIGKVSMCGLSSNMKVLAT